MLNEQVEKIANRNSLIGAVSLPGKCRVYAFYFHIFAGFNKNTPPNRGGAAAYD